MKFCVKCGRQIEDNAAFCNYCGQAQGDAQQTAYNGQAQINAQQPTYNAQPNYGQPGVTGVYNSQPVNNQGVNYGTYQTQPQQQQFQQPVQQPFQPPVQQPKKGLKAGHIVLIVLGVVLLIGIVIGVSGLLDSSDSDSGNSGYYDEYDDSSSVSYTKGETNGDVYVNEWADIKIDYNDIWGMGTQDAFDSYEDDVTDCGFLSADDAGNQFALCFEELAGAGKLLDAEGYLDILKGSMVESYDDLDITSSLSDVYEYTIAGEEYLVCDFTLNDGAVYQRVCVRILDDHAVSFIVTSFSTSEIDEKLAMVQNAD